MLNAYYTPGPILLAKTSRTKFHTYTHTDKKQDRKKNSKRKTSKTENPTLGWGQQCEFQTV